MSVSYAFSGIAKVWKYGRYTWSGHRSHHSGIQGQNPGSVTYHPTQVNAPRLNLSGTRFIYPRGILGWVDLWYSAMERPGVELATPGSQVWHPQPPHHRATRVIQVRLSNRSQFNV